MIVADLFPTPSTFQVPNDSVFAADALQARVDFLTEMRYLRHSHNRPYMGTTGLNLATTASRITEIETRYRTLVDCAIDEAVAKVKGA